LIVAAIDRPSPISWNPAHIASMVEARRKRPRDPNQLGKLVVDIAVGEVQDRPPTPEEQGKDPAAVALGQRGGQARASGLSARKRKEIAKKAAKARWGGN
jgi:hypothetical protein